MTYTQNYWDDIKILCDKINSADAIAIGAGAGLSAAAGLTYSGERFMKHFSDFHEKYGIEDMYSGGFYPFPSPEEYWAWWSHHIKLNRYDAPAGAVYKDLLELVRGKNYFVITSNVDHQFQKAGFDKSRMFYMQGDYGLFQCSVPCCDTTYDNHDSVMKMCASAQGTSVPSELVPHCPKCGAMMDVNLRRDNTFVENDGMRTASDRYQDFIRSNSHSRMLFMELGVGYNTPGIIKYQFWRETYSNPNAFYISINRDFAQCPIEISSRSMCIRDDIGHVLHDALSKSNT